MSRNSKCNSNACINADCYPHRNFLSRIIYDISLHLSFALNPLSHMQCVQCIQHFVLYQLHKYKSMALRVDVMWYHTYRWKACATVSADSHISNLMYFNFLIALRWNNENSNKNQKPPNSVKSSSSIFFWLWWNWNST